MRHLPEIFFAVSLVIGGLPQVAPSQVDTVARTRIVLDFRPGVRPGIMVLSGPGLDSVRAIVARDLAYSDAFEMAPLPDSLSHVSGALDVASMKGTAMKWVVELQPAGTDVDVKLINLLSGDTAQKGHYTVDRAGVGDSRLAIHQISDHIVNWATGGIGIAATQILYLQDLTSEVFRIDTDGQNLVRVSPKGVKAMSPAWSPDASRVAYSDRTNSGNISIVIQTLKSGNRVTVTTTSEHDNWNATFSHDGKMMAFAKASNEGSGEIWTANTSNFSSIFGAQRVTTSGLYAENLAPTFNRDGQFIAFETTRGGNNEIWVMDADGSSPRRLINFDGKAEQPNWSPDGSKVAFDGVIGEGAPQVYYYDVVNNRTVQVTSTGRNEYASWAPDSRHLVFRRTDAQRAVRMYIWDTETGESRMLDTPGNARYPAWSPIIEGNMP